MISSSYDIRGALKYGEEYKFDQALSRIPIGSEKIYLTVNIFKGSLCITKKI